MTDAAPRSGDRLLVDNLRSALAGPFSLRLGAGGCAAVTGPSGSGKSLFLRMIADLDVNEGAIALDGRPREAFAPHQWRRQVVYVAAEAGWWADGVKAHFRKNALARAAALAGALGLDPGLIDGLVARLSTGERQRLALVRALLLQSPVLLLDEPTGALDQDSTAKVEAVIRDRLAAGVAVVLVTHDPALAQRLGTARYHMADRRLAAA
jgi:ABC-type iron transport system FetAB ATPase subunit